MSDTPRTDAVINGSDDYDEIRALCRTLEREANANAQLVERLGEGLSYDGPERRSADLEAFHEWQYNRYSQRV